MSKMSELKGWLKARPLRALSNERGAEMIEVALWAALVSVVSIAIITTIGKDVKTVYTAVSTALAGAV